VTTPDTPPARSLHVAVINRHLRDGVGGSELQCDLFARGLVARGHRVTYLALDGRSVPDAAPSASGPPYAIRTVRPQPSEILSALDDLAPDVVYWRFGRQGLARVVAGLEHRAVPLVFAVAHVDDVTRWPTRPRLRGPLRMQVADLRDRLRHRRGFAALGRVTALAAQREDFLDRAGVALEAHVPNVMDPAQIPFTWPRPYVAWVGNLKARKRPELCLPLAAMLEPLGVDLLIAGAVQDERYRDLTRPSEKAPNLHYLGVLTHPEVAGLLSGAACLAVSAMPEGFSNVLIQAWWFGTPSVSLDYDPDGLIAGEGLGAVCGGDVGEFLAAVVRFVTDRGVREEAGTRAAALARARFDPDRNVAALERLLLAAVARRH